MRLAFVVGDVRAQSATYATAYLAQAGLSRGHDVGFVGVDDLTLLPDNQVSARVIRPASATKTPAELCAAIGREDAVATEELLGAQDVVFLRYNPNRDGDMLNPAVEFGWRLKLSGVLVVNDPDGTQRAGGRMYLSGLPAEIRPRTLITREPPRVKAFLKALDAPAVIKPLSDREGDKTTFYVPRGQTKNLNQIITVVRKTGYVVVHEFLPEAAQGEKRLLLLAGEPIKSGRQVAIYRRLADENAQALGGQNGRSRGERKRCELGPAEQRIVELLRPKLVEDGLYFVAVDIVGTKVLEVNVFTPGGIHANIEVNGIDVADIVIKDLERRIEVRKAYRKIATA
jgi:glutathione synthase